MENIFDLPEWYLYTVAKNNLAKNCYLQVRKNVEKGYVKKFGLFDTPQQFLSLSFEFK